MHNNSNNIVFLFQPPLRLIFESENESSGMSRIMRQLHEKYVPTKIDENVEEQVNPSFYLSRFSSY